MRRIDTLIHALLLVAITLMVGFLSTRYGFVHDFSRSRHASLDAATVDLLHSMTESVEIVSYARPGGGLRHTVAEFIERYSKIKPDLSLRFVDPDIDPAAMREAGVQIDGEMDVRYRGRSERLRSLDETSLSSALLRLSRSGERIVAFLEGEGERNPTGVANADLGQFGKGLGERGVRITLLGLASTPKIPDNVAVLVIASPRVALSTAAVDEVLDFVERGGHLLWLQEPDQSDGLERLAEALSIRALPGTLVDGAGSAHGIEDPSFVAVDQYPQHEALKDFRLGTVFPQARALAQLSPPRWQVQPLLRTSAQSWNETGHIPKAGEPAGEVRYDGTNGEMAGPLDFGFALSRLSPRPGASEQRVVVIGDGDFLSNSFLGNGGNRELGERVFDWLLADDALISIPKVAAADSEIVLSDAALGTISFGFLLVLPLMLLGTGFFIWRRRRRH